MKVKQSIDTEVYNTRLSFACYCKYYVSLRLKTSLKFNVLKWALLPNITKLVLAAIVKQNIFYLKNVHNFMFFNVEPNFIGKKNPSLKWFSNFGHVLFFSLFFTKRKCVFWPPFWNVTFFIHYFSLYCFGFIHIYSASFVRESTQKWIVPPPPLCTKEWKNSLGA